MIHARSEYYKEVVDQHRSEVQVELQRLVVQFNIGHFTDDILEQGLFPCHSGVGHHGLNSIVILFIFLVQKHKFRP